MCNILILRCINIILYSKNIILDNITIQKKKVTHSYPSSLDEIVIPIY